MLLSGEIENVRACVFVCVCVSEKAKETEKLKSTLKVKTLNIKLHYYTLSCFYDSEISKHKIPYIKRIFLKKHWGLSLLGPSDLFVLQALQRQRAAQVCLPEKG